MPLLSFLMNALRRVLPVAVVFLLVATTWAADAPDLVVFGGRIVTGEADGSVAQAMAVRAGRIVALGSTEEISRLGDASTGRIDLQGDGFDALERKGAMQGTGQPGQRQGGAEACRRRDHALQADHRHGRL